MKAGQKLVGGDGYEYLLWPMTVEYVIQASSPSSYTHCCGNSLDINGAASGVYPFYAPCSCTMISKPDESTNCEIWQSTKPVHTASRGLTYICFQVGHANAHLYNVGDTVAQGTHIYNSGLKGANGVYHVHMEFSTGTGNSLHTDGAWCSGSSFSCYYLTNSVATESVCFGNDTTVTQAQGVNLKTATILEWIIPQHTRALNQSEMNNNAKCMYGYLHIKYGWTLQACCGLLGNFQYESSINPNRWQSDAEGVGPGFGLAQWTPYTVCTEYLASRNAKLSDYGNFECDLLNSGTGYAPTATYPLSFEEFKKSTMDAGDLALAFLYNYERPADPGASAFQARKPWAQQWYQYLKNWTPVLPGGASDGVTERNMLHIKTVNGIVVAMSVVQVEE